MWINPYWLKQAYALVLAVAGLGLFVFGEVAAARGAGAAACVLATWLMVITFVAEGRKMRKK